MEDNSLKKNKYTLKIIIKLILIILFSFLIYYGYRYYASEQELIRQEEAKQLAYEQELEYYNDQFSNNLYYSQLTDSQKEHYINIYKATIEFSSEYIPYTNTTSIYDIQRAIAAINYEHPELFWISNNIQYKTLNDEIVEVSFSDADGLDGDEIKDYYQMIIGCADEINSLAENYEGIDQIKCVHDYICKKYFYDVEVEYSQDIRSMVIYDKGVCAGYTKLFQLCMQKLGVSCYYVYGTADNGKESGNHAWDLVIYNDYAYFVDVTWDDDNTNNVIYDDYFMIGKEIFDNHIYGDDEYKFILPN